MAEPWRCPDCGAEHRCADGGSTPAPPADPGPSPAPINITVNVEGGLLSERDLARTVQQAIQRQHIRNPRNPGV